MEATNNLKAWEGNMMKKGQVVRTVDGQEWLVLAVDPDRTARVWVVSGANPDQDAMFLPEDLEVVAK